MTKTLNELQKEFETLVSNNQNEIKSVTEKLELKKNEMTDLQYQLKKAEKEINIDNFEKVNKDLWVVTKTIKMLETKLNSLQTEPIIVKEQMYEYEREINKSTQEQMKRARALVKKIEGELTKALLMDLDARVKGDQLLDKVERDLVRKNRDYFKNEDGTYRGNLHLDSGNTTLRYEIDQFMKNALE